LAEVLTDAKRLGIDIGNDTLLEKYQKWRRFDSSVMLATTDSLNRLFSNDIRPIKIIRDFGLAAIDKLNPVKKRLMLHAMGSTGNLPRLLKGQPL
jgi:2-octaprenyl-6-methoxyphenol hydroxylase